MTLPPAASRVAVARFTHPAATLDDAVAAGCAAGLATALLYGREACRLVRLGDLEAGPLAGVYEARLFGTPGEVRWVEGAGAVALGEQLPSPAGWQALPPWQPWRLARGYLLSAPGLELARGVLEERPSAADPGEPRWWRLTAWEYLEEWRHPADAPYGNVVRRAERLVALEERGGFDRLGGD